MPSLRVDGEHDVVGEGPFVGGFDDMFGFSDSVSFFGEDKVLLHIYPVPDAYLVPVPPSSGIRQVEYGAEIHIEVGLAD